MLAARGDPAAIHKLEEEAKWHERNQQLHLQEKERDRHLMHQQVRGIPLHHLVGKIPTTSSGISQVFLTTLIKQRMNFDCMTLGENNV